MINYFKSSKQILSSISIYIVIAVCIFIVFNIKNFEKFNRVIEYDVHTYYGYLPAIFIYDDIKVEKDKYLFDENYELFWMTWDEDGTRLMKMTMGTAFFYAPFFFVAHLFAILTDYPENGFSEPYKLMLLMSSVLFLFAGLTLVRSILLKLKFTDLIVAITILLIGLGTNLLAYSSQSAPLSHVYSFFLFAAFIYLTIQWFEKPVFRNSILLGLTFGFISLVRPTNSVIVVFFLFYGITNWNEFKNRIQFIFCKKHQILTMVLLTLIVWIPQFLYWKVVTGVLIYYSYTNEGFNFLQPKIFDGLFSFRKGWLIYTPIMIFSLIGIFFLRNKLNKFRLPIITFFIINIYIIFSWWCWWYGGTFGQRTLIESYAILAIPFASFVGWINSKQITVQIPFYLVAGFFIWLNIFQTYQFENKSLHWDGMSRELYFKQFGKMDRIPDYNNYVHWIDYEKEKKGSKRLFSTTDKKKVINLYTGNIENKRKKIYIKAANGKYLTTNENNLIVAEESKNKHSVLTLILFNDDEFALKAPNNHFFCTELNNKSEITATRSEVNSWETFTLIKIDKKNYGFIAANNKYLSLDHRTGVLFANADTVGENEKFQIIEKKLFFLPDLNL